MPHQCQSSIHQNLYEMAISYKYIHALARYKRIGELAHLETFRCLLFCYIFHLLSLLLLSVDRMNEYRPQYVLVHDSTKKRHFRFKSFSLLTILFLCFIRGATGITVVNLFNVCFGIRVNLPSTLCSLQNLWAHCWPVLLSRM